MKKKKVYLCDWCEIYEIANKFHMCSADNAKNITKDIKNKKEKS